MIGNELPGYAELHCVTNFSFLRGASHGEELVERAAALGYAALAITDECSLAGVVRAHVEAKEHGLHLIIGTEIDLLTAGAEHYAKLVLLATDRAAYGNLSELITLARTRADKGSYRAYASDLEGRAAGHPHLQHLPGCLALLIPSNDASFEQLFGQAMWLKTWFPERAWIAVENLLRATDGPLIERIERVASITGVPLVAAGDVHMHLRSRKPVLDVAAAIRLGKPVAECGFALASNAEQYLRPRVRLAQLYAPEWLDETLKIAARCRFSLNELRYEYPEEIVPPGATVTSHLRALTEAGACERFPEGVPPAVRAQIEKELALVAELKYEAFFLTIEDVVRFARSQGILCQGRGSAANSVVCYCLRITEVDPRRCNVLFERFISRERNEPPDIDVDFEHQRREEVIQYIYKKYGRDRAALAATVICYRSRSVLRDVGKALGFDPQRIDQVAKNHQWWDSGQRHSKGMIEAGFDPDSFSIRQWLAIANELRGFPRHLSQHVGGFVIARTKLSRLVPIENAAMEDRCVIQWDKDDLESLGLLKVDVLALGMLSATRRALEFIAQKLGRPFAMGDIEDDDTPTYDMICAADTIGTFQIESRAQMTMLPRLKPRCYYDLVVEVAIVRPGPIQGGMVHPYLRRRDEQGAGRLSEQGNQIGARANARRSDLSGAGDAARDRRRRLHARRGRSAAPLDGGVETQRRARAAQRATDFAHDGQGICARICRAHLQADRRVRRIRISGKSRSELCVAGVCVVLDQAPSSRCIPGRAAEQPADGFLCARATGAGRAPARSRSACRRRDDQSGRIDARAAYEMQQKRRRCGWD